MKNTKEKFYFIHAIRYEFLFKLQLQYPNTQPPTVRTNNIIGFIDLFAMLSVVFHCFMFTFYTVVLSWRLRTLMWEKGKLKMCNGIYIDYSTLFRYMEKMKTGTQSNRVLEFLVLSKFTLTSSLRAIIRNVDVVFWWAKTYLVMLCVDSHLIPNWSGSACVLCIVFIGMSLAIVNDKIPKQQRSIYMFLHEPIESNPETKSNRLQSEIVVETAKKQIIIMGFFVSNIIIYILKWYASKRCWSVELKAFN